MSFENLQKRIENVSKKNIDKLHQIAKTLWAKNKFKPNDIQNICIESWETIQSEIGSNINPLIKAHEEYPITNLIFGSGSFSTGEFQASQYKRVKSYLEKPPVILQGIVTNKSEIHGCNGKKVASKFNVPYISLDYTDWYHEFIDKNESNPTRATRYWYHPNDDSKPPFEELTRRFDIRQNQFHMELGKEIKSTLDYPTNIVSARGYNFQFCRNIFDHQRENSPHINDTHPADMTFINPISKRRLYPGWQSGAIQLMLDDNIRKIRGSLIEVDYMDEIEQIQNLDEGVLLAIGQGVNIDSNLDLDANKIQDLLKIMDDYFFCTLEPTGILLLWGISENKIPIIYQDRKGRETTVMEKAVFVGNKLLSGLNAFGSNLSQNLDDLKNFLFI
ncbi:MAG: hypothetical protein ACFFEY_05775 [Candidatus Thorarchaeota archaeon]